MVDLALYLLQPVVQCYDCALLFVKMPEAKQKPYKQAQLKAYLALGFEVIPSDNDASFEDDSAAKDEPAQEKRAPPKKLRMTPLTKPAAEKGKQRLTVCACLLCSHQPQHATSDQRDTTDRLERQ